MASAASRVFAIPELLEMILLQVRVYNVGTAEEARSIKDPFLLQRVNTVFRSRIERSAQLQRDMLLAFEADEAPAREMLSGLEFLLLGYHFSAEALPPALPCLDHEPPEFYRYRSGDVTVNAPMSAELQEAGMVK